MYMVYCDSSIEPMNPNGILAWAFVAKYKGEIIHQDVAISGWGPGTTSNQGEHQAVVGALLWLIQLPKEKQLPVVLHSDSQLIVNQCLGHWQCKDEKLVPLLAMTMKAVKKYKKTIFFKWIPREQNEEADALSRTLYTKEAIEIIKKNQAKWLFGGDDIPF